ncbi:hypothetical protein [Salinimonas chungwhensis]|uniref:hypothetical protein n=1 Tax=Salinimonas chungwhensis TaxID=265425 RepID=UPI00035C3C88|nr:hypothetical protein [Salinimonas chungwhensis]
MNKTIKKRENALICALTEACEMAKDWNIGFQWLTHTARHNAFPHSLLIFCVFSSDAEMDRATERSDDEMLRLAIQKQLAKIGVRVKDIRQHVRIDSEESCLREDQGNWQKRLARLSV